MKRVLPIAVFAMAVLAVPVAAIVIGSRAVWMRAGRLAWPLELGTLEDLPKQYPKRGTSADAQRLVALARPVGIELLKKSPRQSDLAEAIADFVKGEQPPPAAVTDFLAQHERDIDAVRDHLLTSRDIAWELDLDRGFAAPHPYLLAHLQLERLLIARALVRARSGDARAWEDLRAVTALGRSLQSRPELVTQLIALHLTAAVTEAAWKMPLPAPPWLAEFHKEDRRRILMRGMQHDAWLMWRFGPDEKGFPAFYLRASVANLVIVERGSAVELARTHGNFDGRAFDERRKQAIARWNLPARRAIPNFGNVWSLLLRYEATRMTRPRAMTTFTSSGTSDVTATRSAS